MDADSEFAFELAVCRWAERSWDADGAIVGRQVGTRHRRWDTVIVECDRDALARRALFGPAAIDDDLLDVLPSAPAEWAWYRDALPDPGYPWRYVRETIHRADDRGVLDVRKRGGRLQIRRRWAYPDWVERIVAIENKPDLDASAADRLADQLEFDVALALADEIWVATEKAGERVPRALLEDFPVEAGVLAVDGDVEVLWQPRSLADRRPGLRILDRGGDRGAARFEYADADWTARRRQVIAERVYERGWRSYLDALRPDCRHFEAREVDRGVGPHCGAYDRVPSPGECRGGCPEFTPEPPVWRTRDWPIDGGPGRGVRRVLDAQRRRERPGQTED
ncbi:MAG: DUF5787 family protein [Halococcoides sp.]